MKTTEFFYKYLNDNAIVSICNTKGSIFYNGELGEVPFSLVAKTRLISIDGLGENGEIFITIEKE